MFGFENVLCLGLRMCYLSFELLDAADEGDHDVGHCQTIETDI